jgi:hypothetical protein
MASIRFVLGLGLTVATLVVVIVNSLGNVALIFKAGPTPVLSIAAMVLSAAAFVVSWNQRSYLISGVLAIGGIIFMVPALSAMGYSFNSIVFPGPVLGVIFGLIIFGFGTAMGMKRARALKIAS